ncbi:glutamic acid-rich protein-like isoform X2 [Abrus precatorius]|uniref:Glutamic acid-rich protein-like isoform X2 n=1 Tax=Abrus precatorius TaxID=3816 RepID=A0A8B8KDP9_ABRPR|nr:glutamic acid-rich protein-like isoform X2 [Abrus precatorius]XP_027341911.1 glutamic acid-rich protein-like isoform X2 [Abrus precatorius]
MGEEEPVNEVTKTDSNGKNLPEKTLDEISEKKDLETDGGKVLEKNEIKELKENVKEIEEDKKADGVEKVEEDKKVGFAEEAIEDKKEDRVEEVKEDKKDGVKEVKEDKEVDGVEEVKEDKDVGAAKEVVEDKKDDDAKKIEEDKKDDHISENDKMDEDTEDNDTREGKQENEVEAEKPEVDAMEVEVSTQEEESNDKEKTEVEMEDEDNIDKSKDEEKPEDSKAEKRSQKRGRGKINGEKVKGKRKEVKKIEPRTPTIDRPVRERKSVERLVASIEKDATKEFHIEKGRGTPLKDIPNVAFKLSRRKTGDTFKLLHNILFGRRGKAVQIKSNISRFSGFVWLDNEEKQMIKVKEKFDKCNKEKLMEFCDVLDITIAKATTRKEDIIAKLIDFLVAPHATTAVLLAEKEPNKGKKRKRVVKWGSSRSGITSRRSAKRPNKNEDSSVVQRKSATDTEDESDEEEKDEENEEENENGVPEKSEEETLEKSESEDESDSGSESEDIKKKKKLSKTSSAKKESATKSKIEKITVAKKSRSAPKRTPKKSSSTLSKSDDDSDGSPKVFSRKKKNEKGGKQKTSTPIKSVSKEKAEKVTKGKAKKKEKLGPSDGQLCDAICEILKEVDFNTATFTDILKKLAKQFDVDLTPRKASIKLMIQEELTKLAYEADDEDGEKDEAPSTGQEVEV